MQQPLLPWLERRQWLLQHLPSGLYLRDIDHGAQWTEHSALAFAWLSTEPILRLVRSNRELFGDLSQLQTVELTFLASRRDHRDWICNV